MEQTAPEDFKHIIARRDRRYDGRFFFGVKTTRIYCRPVCPAKPKPENIRIFKSPSEAERNGYRACLRCRPELAPSSKFFDGTLRTVSRALRIIGESGGTEIDIATLADSLGVSDRHLRRLFDEHLGASPIEVMITQRLHLSRQLIQGSALPVSDIAFATGFQSVRRFNEAFKQRFRVSPSALRKERKCAEVSGLSLKLAVRTPYDWKTVIAYLARHECYGVERVTAEHYRRFLPLTSGYGTVTVSHLRGKGYLNVDFTNVPLTEVRHVLQRIKQLFDVDHNPVDLPSRGAITGRGIRVPGSFDPFEAAVSIILSQLVTTKQAKEKLKRLVVRFGKRIGQADGEDVFRFPAPEVLSTATLEEIGLTRVKAGAIRELAAAVNANTIDFNSHGEFSELRAHLEEIKGIGPWTAAMISMRCFGDPDAFPKADLIIHRAIERQLIDHQSWRSSRAYLTHCVWRDLGSKLSKTTQPKRRSE